MLRKSVYLALLVLISLSFLLTAYKGQTQGVSPDTYTLIFNVNPPGAGSVTRNPDKEFYFFSEQVALTVKANSGYTLDYWTAFVPGDKDISGVNPATIYITANFTSTPPPEEIIYVSKDGVCGAKAPCYTSVQDGINAATTPAAIRITQETFNENVIIDLNETIYLEGGWNSDFSNNSGQTTINGSLTISNGTMIIENVILQ